MKKVRDHGGGLDAAVERYGGKHDGWIDLSTGINPHPFPIGHLNARAWTALPDRNAIDGMIRAARTFWNVPESAAVISAPGCSAIISRLPTLWPAQRVCILQPTYNEHAAAFDLHGWDVTEDTNAKVRVDVHPNNPDGRLSATPAPETGTITILDESFCDTCPEASLVALTARPGTIVLKSFGKFWGLAGLRLGFAIGHPATLGKLSDHLGPWAVAGPALDIGTKALTDIAWAVQTRLSLAQSAKLLDQAMLEAGAQAVCGTDLFRTYDVADAAMWQDALAKHHIWSRIFPYSKTWLRLGLPHADHWPRVKAALNEIGQSL